MSKTDFGTRVTRFWLSAFFSVATHTPFILKLLRPIVIRGVPIFSAAVRKATRCNAVRLAVQNQRVYAREVIGHFYDFVTDIGRKSELTADELRRCISSIEGQDEYRAMRKAARGAVLVTAHMGSFEIGLAALTQVENAIHVVFKRDEYSAFETLRTGLRERLGVTESPIDDGWPTLVKLRDALARDEVVVMQGDRAMPGQKNREVKLGLGMIRIPVGPITLACINQSPVVPVFTVREPDGRFRVWIEPAIDPTSQDAIEQVGRVIEKFVLKYPDQWLVLQPVFVEDTNCGKPN